MDVERETVERHRTDEGDPKQSKVHKTARFRKEVVGKGVASKEVKMKEVKIQGFIDLNLFGTIEAFKNKVVHTARKLKKGRSDWEWCTENKEVKMEEVKILGFYYIIVLCY